MRRMKKFLGASKVKVFAKNQHKITEYSETWQNFGDLNFKNSFESHFSFIKKCFVSRTVMKQNAVHFPVLGECFTYPERMRTTHEKFSTGV